MVKFFIYIAGMILLLTGSITTFAQEPGVKATIDKNEILIGQPLRFSIDVKSPTASGNFLPQFDSLPHFELIEKGSRDSIVSAEGTSYHLEWKLTSFDSGTQHIPAFPITVGNRIFHTDSLLVEVSYGNVDTAKDYHDIKGIVDLENPDVQYIPWIVGILTAIGLFVFIWFIRAPIPKAAVVTNTTAAGRATALDEALASLDQLKKMDLTESPAVKKYYVGMHDVLRQFLNRRFGLVTMEKTSEELILSLSKMDMNRDAFSKLTETLRMGDFVKFAKYIPGPYENEQNLEVMRTAITNLNETGK